ncbi:Ferroporti-1 [Rhodocollybia butyracea]|uniref:Solute carrier family 40 member n=1 Tax=Rhodocollybia butyracea TaxID=206335 RepID=A0A9P5Q4T9_9AGAR|nr:Ferroporti-1 [Rhodocollybia butyracea]
MSVLNESTPLIPSSEQPAETHAENEDAFDRTGLRCLLIQHLSSAWGDRTAEFAVYLYLIDYFEDTLLPSSILGFAMTLSGIAWSRWAGSLVDKYNRLWLVRASILVQKLSALSCYTCFSIMLWDQSKENLLPFDKIRRLFSLSALTTPRTNLNDFVTLPFLVLVFSGCILSLSNICISIAVEKDWASTICRGPTSSDKLSRLNTYLRQINLLCKLCAPLFVSFLTVGYNNIVSLSVLSLIAITSMIFELYWIRIVYKRFPTLESEQSDRLNESHGQQPEAELVATTTNISTGFEGLRLRMKRLIAPEWTELIRLPVFFSSLAISLLYITVLSFDGIMVGYLKMLSFSDDLIAEMRGLCVITGLLGTALALPLEKRIGTERAGNWSIWSMVLSLAPVLFALCALTTQSSPGHPGIGLLGAILIFGGMALSRIGLWAFDLIQTKQLQIALITHPKRNSLTALQYTMQNVASLIKFSLTMVFWRPSQFRWAAVASFTCVSSGALVYMVYVKKTRGHIMHLDWIKKIL